MTQHYGLDQISALTTYVDGIEGSIGTLANTGGGAETLAAIIGDVQSVDIATRLTRQEVLSSNSSRYLAVTADMTLPAWQTFGAPGPTHKVFDVTGIVRLRMWIECTGTLDSALDGATICFGHANDTNFYITATDDDALVTGDLWYSATPLTSIGAFADVVFDVVSNGVDIGYEIAAEALTAGSLVFHCVWEPLSAGGLVISGAGAAL